MLNMLGKTGRCRLTSPPAIPAIICKAASTVSNSAHDEMAVMSCCTKEHKDHIIRALGPHLLGKLVVRGLSIGGLVFLVLTHGREGCSALHDDRAFLRTSVQEGPLVCPNPGIACTQLSRVQTSTQTLLASDAIFPSQ